MSKYFMYNIGFENYRKVLVLLYIFLYCIMYILIIFFKESGVIDWIYNVC